MSLLATIIRTGTPEHAAPQHSRRGPGSKSPTESLLLNHAMSLVAEAEQMLADQRARISYLEGLTMTDELTGLFNRRGFFDRFRRELGAARRSWEQSGTLVLCDLDGFKQVNDTLGHLAGDAALRHVASVLKSTVREIDCVARLGGDEFTVLLTATDVPTARARVAHISEALNSASILWDGHRIGIRASVGYHPYDGESLEDDVLAAADRMMYMIKERRRTPR